MKKLSAIRGPRLAAGLITMAVTVNVAGCGGIVIKGHKKHTNRDVILIEDNTDLTSNNDFSKTLKNLIGVAPELILNELASKDYVGKIRKSFRNYRNFIVALGANNQLIANECHNGDAPCPGNDFKLNMNDTDVLDTIAQTALFGIISEVSALKLNPKVTKEMAALSQLVLREIGLEVVDQSQADKADDATMINSNVVMRLKEIPGEKIDGESASSEMMARDAAETVNLQFSRSSRADSIDHFEARVTSKQLIDVASSATSDTNVTFVVERFKENSKFVYTVLMTMAKAGSPTSRSRMLSFREDPNSNGGIAVVELPH